jgi:type IV secretion system protein VirB4
LHEGCGEEWEGEVSAAVVPIVEYGHGNLIDFLDVRPAFARRSPATASAALLRAGLVGNGSAALGKHRPFISDAVLIVSKPTLHECDAALVYANGDSCGLLLVDNPFVQATPKGIRPFIGGCRVLLFCVIDGDVVLVGDGKSQIAGQSFTLPHLKELLRLGNLSAFYAMFPGNHKFNVFPMWLAEDHHARLSSVFAPHIGHPRSDDLDSEYLNIFETRTRTPFFQDVYVDGVRVMLIIGPTGSGKSVHANMAVAHEQKYGGFTYIFDIGGSYESVVELYGGKVDRVGKDGPRVNPFSLEPTESNIKFLFSFIKLLLTNGGAELEPEDDDVIHKAVQGMYLLDTGNRRLSNLFLPKKLDRYLSKWVGKGIYNAVFDNVEDSLSLSRLQCFDFQGVNNEQYADLIEPLMVWLLRRINDVLYNPENLGVPKHILIEEIFSSMKNKQLLDGALASIKTVRKNLGGVTMIGQSADDLGANADSIVNSCTSFLFLKDATFNRKRYTELFKMNEQQIALFESLQDREGLYMRRDGLTKVVTLNLDSRSYATFSTKPKDRVRRTKLIEKYGLTEGIARFAQDETV